MPTVLLRCPALKRAEKWSVVTSVLWHVGLFLTKSDALFGK